MKAAYLEATGAPDVLRYGDVPTPTPKIPKPARTKKKHV